MSPINWGWIRYCWLALVIILGALFTTRSTEAAFFVRNISGVMPTYADVVSQSIQISPDGKYVVYLADNGLDDIYDLYSVSIRGTTPTRLSQEAFAGRIIDPFEITPDSNYVIFRSDAVVDDKYELFSVPISGGTPVR